MEIKEIIGDQPTPERIVEGREWAKHNFSRTPAALRICITGGPKTGKTTLATDLAAPGVLLCHTDALIDLGWSEASQFVADKWLGDQGESSWIVEGVAVPRALRKWLDAHPEGKPCDVACWLDGAHAELSKGQATMAKGCATVWREIFDQLVARGVRVLLGAQALLDELASKRTHDLAAPEHAA